MHTSRTSRTLALGVLMGFLFWSGLSILYVLGFHFAPDTPSMPRIRVFVFAIILPLFGLMWIGVLMTFFAAWRAAPVRITIKGIELPVIPFRAWLSGAKCHFVPWEDLRIVRLSSKYEGQWWAVVADRKGRRYGFGGGWFGAESPMALNLLRGRSSPSA